MSEKEIATLKNSIRLKTELWKTAFKQYNDDPSNSVKLHMGCAPCWFKVLKYHIDKNKPPAN